MKERIIVLLTVLLMAGLMSAASITGMITVEEGDIFDCDLYLYHGQNIWSPVLIETVTAGEEYELNDLMPGNYRLQIVPWSFSYPPEFYPGVPTPEEAEILMLMSPEDILTGIDFTLENNGTYEAGLISGTLIDESGNGLDSNDVYLYGVFNNYWNTYIAQTDDDGNFTFAGIVPGSYLLFVQHIPGYQHYFWEGGHNFQQADIIEIRQGEELTGLVLEMEPVITFEISGTVTELDQGIYLPLSDALVSGYSINCWGEGEYFQDITDEYGHYSAEISPGMYWLFSTKQGYTEQYWENVPTYDEATPLHMNHDMEDIDFVLETIIDPDNNSISGHILDDGEEPGYPCMVIVVASDEDDDWSDTTLSESSGYYYIDEIPAGEYYVVMLTSTTPPVYYPEGYDWENAVIINIDGNVIDIDFDVQSPTLNGIYTIDGIIEEPDRTPVAGATVLFFDEDNFPMSYAISDADGHYEAVSMSTGTYNALATKTFYNGDTVEFSLTESSEIDFVINPTLTNTEEDFIPETLSQMQCYPNPFFMGSSRSAVNIKLSPQTAGAVRISVYNLRGQLVKNIFTGWLDAEPSILQWNGDSQNGEAGSGIYLMSIERDGKVEESQKILLIK